MTAARQTAVRELFDAEYPRLVAWCSALSNDRSVGEDIAQEAFARLLARWQWVKEPRPFLYTVATNLVNDSWKQQRRSRSLLGWLARSGPADVPGPDGSVRDLIRRLPERQRLAVLLHYYGGLSLVEVAAHLDKPEGTVRRWLAEGRASLRAQLEEAR
jgi:RNA polymerase sigma-70 factor (ECF subfamily)